MITIYNVSPAEAKSDQSNNLISIGLHPWHIDVGWDEQLHLLAELAGEARVMLIGETGLDKVCKTDFDLQKTVFLQHIELAEEIGKPMIIHCVKAWEELVAIRKKVIPSVPWIIHGFRGKPELAKQLLNTGLYLSFGEKFNDESLRITPTERLCTETDESEWPIEAVCRNIAKTKEMAVEELLTKANVIFSGDRPCYTDVHSHISPSRP